MTSAVLRIEKSHAAAVRRGCPWVMRHQAVESSGWSTLPPGSLVQIEDERGGWLGVGFANPLSHIVCRVLSTEPVAIDTDFFMRMLRRAVEGREAWCKVPYYRLAHAEADGLPGLVIDRFGDICVVQVGSAGMERLQPLWLEALHALLAPKVMVLRNDFSARRLEGLDITTRCAYGLIPAEVEVLENDCIYVADVEHGQKTGWFYDMRDNRVRVAALARDKTVLDVFSHSGGFGVLAAQQGARHVTMVDSSALALSLAMKAAEKNGVGERCQVEKADAMRRMAELAAEGARYDVVVADPPAYVKSRNDKASGLKAYEKLAAHAARLVVSGGHLFTATCSHHAERASFNRAIYAGIVEAGRRATVVAQTGAGRDHPCHPLLAQSEYLKGLLLQLD